MKRNVLFTALVASLALTGCGQRGASTSADPTAGFAVDSLQLADSTVCEGSAAVVSMRLVYPSGSDAAADSMRLWLADVMASASASYGAPQMFSLEQAGQLPVVARTVTDSLLKVAQRDFAELAGENTREMFYSFDYNADTLAVTPTYATIQFSGYTFTGGAHGSFYILPAVFTRPEGHQLTWNDLIAPDRKAELLGMIRRALMEQYFDVSTDEAFAEMLLVKPDEITLPVAGPALSPEGLHVIYQQYEIAPYACGMPSCIIPMEDLRPLLNPSLKI